MKNTHTIKSQLIVTDSDELEAAVAKELEEQNNEEEAMAKFQELVDEKRGAAKKRKAKSE